MIKNKLIALAAVATVAGLAAPAFAASAPANNNDDSNSGHWSQFQQFSILASLQQRGVDATSVEQWGPYVRAYVQSPDGSVQQKFFDRDTFAPVTLG